MNYKKTIFMIATLLIFAGCMNKDKNFSLEPTGNQPLELVKLASNERVDQQPSHQAKRIISNYGEVSEVRAVNHDNQLLIAIAVDHFDRFNLDEIEKDLRKNIKRNFSNMKVSLSTDQKILIEVRDLENAISANEISEKEIENRLTQIKKLSEEET